MSVHAACNVLATQPEYAPALYPVLNWEFFNEEKKSFEILEIFETCISPITTLAEKRRFLIFTSYAIRGSQDYSRQHRTHSTVHTAPDASPTEGSHTFIYPWGKVQALINSTVLRLQEKTLEPQLGKTCKLYTQMK